MSMLRTIIFLILIFSCQLMAKAETAPATALVSRIEHHREMAEKRIRDHQAMTNAHIVGRAPVCQIADVVAANATFFTPAFGEGPLRTSQDGSDHVGLNELRMYWHKIPDFGVKRYEIFPSDTGWAQVLYWSGTTTDGKIVEAQEADIIKTNEKFEIVRIENYHDWQQWKALAAFAMSKDPETFDKAAYAAALGAQALSPNEVCRPKAG
jgi:hypothetical protein